MKEEYCIKLFKSPKKIDFLKTKDGLMVHCIANAPIIDRQNDLVELESFFDSINEHNKKNGKKIVMLCNHDSKKICGKWLNFEITPVGLYAHGLVTDSIIIDAILKYSADSVSIGFIPTDVAINAKTRTRTIKKMKLLEVSILVGYEPANSKASVIPERANI
jgi:HK97 family phage prohead protease